MKAPAVCSGQRWEDSRESGRVLTIVSVGKTKVECATQQGGRTVIRLDRFTKAFRLVSA